MEQTLESLTERLTVCLKCLPLIGTLMSRINQYHLDPSTVSIVTFTDHTSTLQCMERIPNARCVHVNAFSLTMQNIIRSIKRRLELSDTLWPWTVYLSVLIVKILRMALVEMLAHPAVILTGRLTPDCCAQKRGLLPTIPIVDDVRSSFALQGPFSQIETITNDRGSDSHCRLDGSQHTVDFQSQTEERRAWIPRACSWS